jgi:predicted nucleic acid-binding protein
MIILDTNVLSEAMRPVPAPEVLHWFAKHAASSLYTTAITQAEILLGLELMPKGKRRAALQTRADEMFEEDFADRVLPFDTDAARMLARIAGFRALAKGSSGRPIAQWDAQIAAIAHSRGATLATRNTADFEHCGIALLNPWTA